MPTENLYTLGLSARVTALKDEMKFFEAREKTRPDHQVRETEQSPLEWMQ
jgi:hypothetical protein